VSVKNPRKLLRDVVRDYGGESLEKQRDHHVFAFPDGYRVTLFNGEHPGSCIAKVQLIQQRYGPKPSGGFAGHRNRRGKPTIDLERLTASTHAQERLALMQRQAGVTYAELLEAIRIPLRVLWSDDHESWLWVGRRVTLPVKEIPSGFVITTVLWSTPDLYKKYPRPEGES
jgi:hypothetical protein